MIDTDKYEGHTPAPWRHYHEDEHADSKLIVDAPLLLAEVKRLRDMLSELASQHGQLLLEVNTLNEIIDTERKKVYDIAQKLLEAIE